MGVPSRSVLLAALIATSGGCSGQNGTELKDLRQSASQAYADGMAAFQARDYLGAELKFSVALGGGLDADQFCIAKVKRAVCWGSQAKYDQALAELDKLGTSAPNVAEVFAARSFILRKQGKAAEADAALAQARRYDRAVKEFK